jgi:hypothetical protein
MSADLFALRDFVERGFMAFDIPYHYLFGEVMEAEIPPTYQPLFGGQPTLKLCFSDVAILDPTIERVTHGALVLDALDRLLEGDRNTVGLALIARRIDFGSGVPEFKDRLSVLNAKVTSTAATIVHRPIIRLEFRLRAITAGGIRSQSVPVFYDVETDRVLDGSRYATMRVHDVEEITSGHDVIGLRTPPPETLAAAAKAAITHIRRSLPPLEPGRDGEPAKVDLRLVRMLVLHDPRAGTQITYKERSTQREFTLSFAVSEDPSRIAPPMCPQCGRIKTHYYISHRTGRLICTDCSLLCVGCWDAYALAGTNCELCNKRRYCPACLHECEKCATPICPDHAQTAAGSGRVYCPACAPEEEPEPAAPPDTPPPTPVPDEPPAPSASAAPSPDLTEDVFAAAPPESPSGDAFPDAAFVGAGADDGEDDIFVAAAGTEPTSAAVDGEADDDPFWSTPGPVDSPAADDEDIFGGIAPDLDRETAPHPSPEEPADASWEDDGTALFEDERPPAADAIPPGAYPEMEDPGEYELAEPDFEAAEATADPEDPWPEQDEPRYEVPLESVAPEPLGDDSADDEVPELDLMEDQQDQEAGSSQFADCACHGYRRDIDNLRMDFLSGRYYCPEEVEPCSNCGQATALDFLEGDPPLCFYCSNRMPLNLDPEGEEIFRREVQPVVPFKYRLSSCRIARSPHHLAFYIKPLVGREIILYWDRWTDTLLDDDQFA